jgi:hypothetical protein
MRRLEHVACADDVGRVDVLLRVERQCGRGVHDDVHAGERCVQRLAVADVAAHAAHAVALGVVERRDRKRPRVPVRQQVGPVDAEEVGRR